MAQRSKGYGSSSPASWYAWEKLALAPVILIKAGEAVLGERALCHFQEATLAQTPQTTVVRLDPAQYTRGELTTLTSPSLFAEQTFIRVDHLETLNADFQADMQGYLENVSDDVTLVAVHSGGNKGSGLLRAIEKAGFPVCTIPKIKYASDKATLVKYEAQRAGRTISAEAVQQLVDALGSNTRELLSALEQLMADVEGQIDAGAVHAYYAGRKEADGFAVADAAISGQTGRAIALARHAIATGSDPVPIVAACAMKLRSMALVLGARSTGRKNSLAPWQVKRATQDLNAWSGEGLARAIEAVAQADADVKGASRDPMYAVERAIIRIGQARRMRT